MSTAVPARAGQRTDRVPRPPRWLRKQPSHRLKHMTTRNGY
jgi:hypothetical protein